MNFQKYDLGQLHGGQIVQVTLQGSAANVNFTNDGSDFWVIFKKDIYNKEELSKLGLNERQIDALLFFKEKGEITSSEYAEKYNISDRTARTDLLELVDKEFLNKQGEYKMTRFYFR
jgi:ATP-dependent DNA helicase RecG